MAARPKAIRVPRRVPPEIKSPVRSLALATGELLWASSQAHTAFCNVFALLVAKDNLNVGFAIWHTVQADSTQRQMLAALVDARLPTPSRMNKSLLWAKEKADKLATLRNDAAHLASAFRTDSDPYKLVPNPFGNPPTRTERLKNISDLVAHFRTVKGDLVQLSGYINALFFKLVQPSGPYPWPRRPSLKSLPKAAKRQPKRR